MTQQTANIFEQASRAKLRYETSRGLMTVENLWELPLTSKVVDKPNLDAIALELYQQIEAQGTTSFVKAKKKDEILQLKFDIVKHIIETVQAENDAKLAENGKQAKRAHLDRLIEQAEDEELKKLSPAELKKMRDAL